MKLGVNRAGGFGRLIFFLNAAKQNFFGFLPVFWDGYSLGVIGTKYLDQLTQRDSFIFKNNSQVFGSAWTLAWTWWLWSELEGSPLYVLGSVCFEEPRLLCAKNYLIMWLFQGIHLFSKQHCLSWGNQKILKIGKDF